MAITIDTHALIWYLDKGLNSKLSTQALAAIENAVESSVVYIPSIVLMEILHIREKNRVQINIQEIFDKLEENSAFEIVPLDIQVIRVALEFSAIEMHDRIICATAVATGSSLVSKDVEIKKNIPVIW